MDKRKLLGKAFRILAVLAAVCLIIFVGYRIYKNSKNHTKTKTPIAHIQSKEEIAQSEKSATGFDDVMVAYNETNYAKAIKLSKTYGADNKNGYVERLNAYVLCMRAAITLKDDKTKTECYNDAKIIANSITLQSDKTPWLNLIDEVNSAKTEGGN